VRSGFGFSLLARHGCKYRMGLWGMRRQAEERPEGDRFGRSTQWNERNQLRQEARRKGDERKADAASVLRRAATTTRVGGGEAHKPYHACLALFGPRTLFLLVTPLLLSLLPKESNQGGREREAGGFHHPTSSPYPPSHAASPFLAWARRTLFQIKGNTSTPPTEPMQCTHSTKGPKPSRFP
jgi:hypothetical protein